MHVLLFQSYVFENILNHLKSPSHRKAAEEYSKRESSENSRPFLQERVDKKVMCARKISEDERIHRNDAVRAAAAANISFAALEIIENSNYKRRHELKPISLGHISHLADDFIPLVHEEDLAILRTILLPHKKGTNRTRVLAYSHFSIIFNGTPSFAEAEVR